MIWVYHSLTESSKSPASIAKSNKQWVGTCLYQEWYKPLLISCEAAIRLWASSEADCEYPLWPESSKSPVSIARSNKQGVGTYLIRLKKQGRWKNEWNYSFTEKRPHIYYFSEPPLPCNNISGRLLQCFLSIIILSEKFHTENTKYLQENHHNNRSSPVKRIFAIRFATCS